MGKLKTIVETSEFIRKTSDLAPREIIEEFINYIAEFPEKGDVIQGTGGARKVRWNISRQGGKSGGMRVIYYYGSSSMPIYLFTAYGKSQRANISSKDKQVLKKIISQIVESYEVLE